MKYAGDDGVAAYGVVMYVSFIFIAIFIGYSIGTAPIASYHYGANNESELKSILRKSSVITLTLGAAMLVICAIFATPLSAIFVSYDKALLDMTARGLFIFSFSFIFTGFSIFASSFFTALNNGPVSAAISFLRTLVFQLGGILILPIFFELDGIWYSIIVSEALAMITTVIFLIANKRKYNYM
jgi:Na+-driven multidrug efflux pump